MSGGTFHDPASYVDADHRPASMHDPDSPDAEWAAETMRARQTYQTAIGMLEEGLRHLALAQRGMRDAADAEYEGSAEILITNAGAQIDVGIAALRSVNGLR